MSTQVAFFEEWIRRMRADGFVVHEAAGWRTRDAEPRSTFLPGMLYIEHHDASSTRSGNWGALNYIINNRLANIVTARDGQITVVAAGVAWHAGVGSRGSLGNIPANGANPRSMGNEVCNSGTENYDPRCTRAIIAGEWHWADMGGNLDDIMRLIGHKEWADPPGRKSDPRVDMDQRRRDVLAYRPGAPAPTIPARPKPTGAPDPNVFPPLENGHFFGDIDGAEDSHGGFYAEERPWITWIQDKLTVLGYLKGLPADQRGIWRQPTTDAMAAFQRAKLPGTTRFGECWADDWKALFSTPNPAPPATPAPTPAVPAPVFDDPEDGSLLRMPVKAGTYRISSPFGLRKGKPHNGIDLASETPGKDYSGAPVFAAEDGVVIEGSERQNVGGFGGWVWIEHQLEDGRVVDTIYGHMYQRDILVKKGDLVLRGQQIGKVGANGDVDGAHLHFEVWTAPGRVGGQPTDPMPYLLKAQVPASAPQPVEEPAPAPAPTPEPEPAPEPVEEPELDLPPEVEAALAVLLAYLRRKPGS